MEHRRLRELIRNLQSWRALYEAYGISTIVDHDGTEYELHDVEYIYGCRKLLSVRQGQAIEYFLFHNIREQDVAEMMGVSKTNPIAIYATQGLVRLCTMINSGELARYRERVAATMPVPKVQETAGEGNDDGAIAERCAPAS